MHVWKFWRDTRRGVFIYLALLAGSTVLWLTGMRKANRIGNIHGDPATLRMMEVGITFALAYLCALAMAFVIGNNSVGSDIGKGTGDFLLSRPRSHAYFVWAGWVAGIVELAVLILITIVFVFGLDVLVTGAAWRNIPSPLHFTIANNAQAARLDVPLMLATVVLTAAVIYGLTYFMTVVLRSGQRGVVWSNAILFGYSIGGGLLKQFAGIELPSLSFANPGANASHAWYLAPNAQITWWTLLSIAFPFGAQISLDRADI
jgi:ABC-type transport system involved in multi-copper enzyme maturation permease subunit